MKISKERFNIRTLAYYQEQGGVYNDIITVLTQLRNDPKHRGLPAPATILNDACYHLAVLKQKQEEEYEAADDHLSGIKDNLLLCIMVTIAEKESLYCMVCPMIYHYLDRSTPIFFKFLPIINHRPVEIKRNPELTEIQKKVAGLERELEIKNAQLDDSLNRIAQLESERYLLDEGSSKADKMLTWNSVLDYIESRQNYDYVSQLFPMLNTIAGRYATEEEWNRKEQLEQKMLNNTLPTVHNHNSISNSNVFQGMMNNPNFPLGVDPEAFVHAAVEQYINKLNNGQG